MTRATASTLIPACVLFVLALAVRLGAHHDALLYPDGYQYLLMARGIDEHLQPTTVLGPAGDGFTPSPDAAAKPLFPLLVAGVHVLGVSWLDAARVVTAVAAALVVTLVALLVWVLSGSRWAGGAAGLLVLASPAVGFWAGFSGPDPLAQALVLSAALAFARHRPRAGGVLIGLAAATRPEVAVVALVAAVVALRTEQGRRDLARAAPAALVAGSLVFVVLRTPIAVPDARFLLVIPVLLVVSGLLALAPSAWLRYAAVAGLAVAALVVLTEPGPGHLMSNDWPLLLLGTAGFVVLILDRSRSATATAVLGCTLVLGAVYVLKNPGLERYFSLLLPAAALLAGLGIAALPVRARPLVLGLAGLAIVAGFARPVPGSRDYDAFSIVAADVAPALGSRPLVTAAPDAYGFWLPDQTVRAMEPGRQGAVLLDAAQRLYEPTLTAHGRVVGRVTDEIAFSRPDGDIDAAPAVLVVGTVVARR